MARRRLKDEADREALDAIREQPHDRSWEKAQRNEGNVATYRGIPRDVRDRVTQIAKDRGLPVGDVARALLEWGLGAYERGDLELQPKQTRTVGRLY